MHCKLTLSYDGSLFHGWQVQPGLRTVQGVLAESIRTLTGEEVLPQGSGRTDAGVHALAQVASFTLPVHIPPDNLLRALNRVLPSAIRVLEVLEVSPSFHARHSVERKTYEYRIFERRRPREDGTASEGICSPFFAPYVWDCRWPLDVERMQAGAALLCGTHDFTSFAASDPERDVRNGKDKTHAIHDEEVPARGTGRVNPVKTVWDSQWLHRNDLLVYRVTGSGFLHHMVRTIVGTLVDIGRGSFEPADITRILNARDRSAAGPTAPARGLFLASVEYPSSIELHAQPPLEMGQ